LLKAKLLVMAGALLFSTGGVAIKLSSLSGWQISCMRTLIAATVLSLFLMRLRTVWTWRSLAVAVPYATTFTLYTLANKLTTAANAIFLQDTAPLYILLLGPLLLRERIRVADVGFIAALVLGLGLIFQAEITQTTDALNPSLGNVLAVCSGMSWALTVVGLRWLAVRSLTQPESPMNAVVAGCLLAGVAGAFFAFPISSIGVDDLLIVTYLGVFQIAFAYVLVNEGIRYLSALQASLLLLVEPVLSPLWAWSMLGENPGSVALAGGALVLLAAVVYTWWGEAGAGRPTLS